MILFYLNCPVLCSRWTIGLRFGWPLPGLNNKLGHVSDTARNSLQACPHWRLQGQSTDLQSWGIWPWTANSVRSPPESSGHQHKWGKQVSNTLPHLSCNCLQTKAISRKSLHINHECNIKEGIDVVDWIALMSTTASLNWFWMGLVCA